MGTVITNLVPYPTIRTYGTAARWASTAAYTISSTTDATAPSEGGTNVCVATQTGAPVFGNAMFTVGSAVAKRFPIDATKTYSASIWVKRVNPEGCSSIRYLLLASRDAAGTAGTTTTLNGGTALAVGVWTQVLIENRAIIDPLTVFGYVALYPTNAGAVGQTNGILYANAALCTQRTVLPPAQRFFDGATTNWAPDTVCTWTGAAGSTASTWTSVRDQIGVINTYDGVSELPVTSTLYDGSAASAQTYVESQVV